MREIIETGIEVVVILGAYELAKYGLDKYLSWSGQRIREEKRNAL